MRQYELHREADAELTSAALYYDVELPGLGTRFLNAVLEAISRICEYPEIGSRIGRIERRVFVTDFPYQVVYRPDGPSIRIVAVAHVRRRPGYWHGRE
ncbi:MAG: type II toxin-antitoxin system RelE/ParE family toxin [Chloroflexota bacterium]